MDVVAADFEEAGDGDSVRKVLADLRAKDVVITEQAIRAKMNELAAQALVQVKAKEKIRTSRSGHTCKRTVSGEELVFPCCDCALPAPASGRWLRIPQAYC
jgi:hypothetical protein